MKSRYWFITLALVIFMLAGIAYADKVAYLDAVAAHESGQKLNAEQMSLMREYNYNFNPPTVNELDEMGGPDLWGYYYMDSAEEGGPVYNWIDITETGTMIDNMGDDTYQGPFELGFDFVYYENVYTEVYICSNGFLMFGGGSGSLGNTTIPNTFAPSNIICFFWDDLNPADVGSGPIYYGDDGEGNWVCTFDGVEEYGGNNGHVTCQTILYQNGEILMQYAALEFDIDINSETIGIENSDGTIGLQVSYNTTPADYPYDELAILYYNEGAPEPDSWVTGTITDLDTGLPIEGAVVNIGGEEVVVGPDGTYMIDELYSFIEYAISVTADTYYPYNDNITPAEGENILDVALVGADSWVTGTITDLETGLPIEGAVVNIGGEEVVVGPEGTYLIEDLFSGTEYAVSVTAENHLSYNDTIIPVEGENVLDVALFGVDAYVTGTVTDLDTGLPIEGAVVHIIGGGVGIAGPDGTYMIEELYSVLEYAVSVTAEFYHPYNDSIAPVEGENVLDVALEEGNFPNLVVSLTPVHMTILQTLEDLEQNYTYNDTVASYSALNLAEYNTVIIGQDPSIDWSFPTLEDYQALVDYCEAGGRVMFFGGGTIDDTLNADFVEGMSGFVDNVPMEWHSAENPHFNLLDAEHPLGVDLPNTFNNFLPGTFHYGIDIDDPDAEVIGDNGDSNPVLVAKNVGDGVFMMMVGTPFELYWLMPNAISFFETVMFNMLIYNTDIPIDIEPWNDPTWVGPNGGSFRWDVTISNVSDETVIYDAWTSVIMPNGNPYGPMDLFTGLSLDPGETLATSPLQTVPGFAPGGVYTFLGNVGVYPTIWAQDRFDFAKLPIPDGPAGGMDNHVGWELTGWFDETEDVTSAVVPNEFAIEDAYPNPFNPMTNISIALPLSSELQVVVFNVIGQQVDVLANGRYAEGYHNLTFDASNLSSGIYFIQATVPGKMSEMRKVVLMK